MFTLSQLGPYRIERTEDYEYAEASGKSYCEMIRVRGSISDPPGFTTPSHLYKYSETELSLYMKDKKNLWRPLGKLLDKKINISDEEIDFIFPVEMFPEVAKIVPFVRKALRKNPMTNAERTAMNEKLAKARAKRLWGMKQNDANLHSSMPEGNITPPTLEDMKTDNEMAIT
jgi:hypothetical protein